MSFINNSRWQSMVAAPIRRIFKENIPHFLRRRASDVRSLIGFLAFKMGQPFLHWQRLIRRYNTKTCTFCRVKLKPLPIKPLTLPLALILQRRHECPHCGIVFIRRLQFGHQQAESDDSAEISQLDDVQEEETVLFRSTAETSSPTTRLNDSNATMGVLQGKPIPSFRVINHAQVRTIRKASRLHLERLARNGRVVGSQRHRGL